ncbi:MAG: hypothetical protein BWK73_01820 [Thiothrix lacustris]|uniref:Uncharacterized protein n=1 Tax=Thiothrix lacustris TaxID=525917 RepID=A0A1Y1QZU8_9GAMM|nr:MAG: hypothetical protein BWK73_01820 [Thiothrix lacustris]
MKQIYRGFDTLQSDKPNYLDVSLYIRVQYAQCGSNIHQTTQPHVRAEFSTAPSDCSLKRLMKQFCLDPHAVVPWS